MDALNDLVHVLGLVKVDSLELVSGVHASSLDGREEEANVLLGVRRTTHHLHERHATLVDLAYRAGANSIREPSGKRGRYLQRIWPFFKPSAKSGPIDSPVLASIQARADCSRVAS